MIQYHIKNIYSHHEVRDSNTHLINNAVKSLCSANGVKWNQFQRNGVVKGLKNRDGWAYLWNKQMNVPLIQSPNLSNFKKLDRSGDIKKTEELKIVRTPYCKEFEGGEKAGKSQLNKFLSETGQTYSKNISLLKGTAVNFFVNNMRKLHFFIFIKCFFYLSKGS